MFKNLVKSSIELVYPIFAVYTVLTTWLAPMRQLAIFLAATLVLIFLKYPAGAKRSLKLKAALSAVDGLLILLSIFSGAYIYIAYPELVNRVGIPTRMDIVLGIVSTLIVLEATRRSAGWALVVIAVCALFYTYFVAEFSINRMITFLYTTNEGIFGIALSVMVQYVVIFILLGSVMNAIGGIDFFLKFSQSIAGRWRSGPAQVAVISSGFMGTISGSAVANVATTGSFTIPLMKKLGYEPHTAGAIESAASTGGQIMPPIMGAAAFLMAEFLGIRYLDVVKAALIPAILFFVSIGMGVYFYAEKRNLQKIDLADLPRIRDVLKEGYYLIPLLCLIYFLISGYSATRSAFYAILTAVAISFFKRKTLLDHKKLFEICQKASNNIIDISVACACAGIVIATLESTGLGLKFSGLILDLSGSSLILCLFLTMIAAIIFGVGLPTTITYIILAVLIAPALLDMGALPLAAHLFVFFFGMMCMVTPPVAFACYVGSAIAGSNFSRTGLAAFKLVFPSFIIAYAFIYDDSLLFQGSYFSIAWSFLVAAIGVLGMSSAIQGWFLTKTGIVDRAAFFCGGVLLIFKGTITDLLGFALIASAFCLQSLKKNRPASTLIGE